MTKILSSHRFAEAPAFFFTRYLFHGSQNTHGVRPLPYIIGTDEFLRDDYIGLASEPAAREFSIHISISQNISVCLANLSEHAYLTL
jgi:hypothetical protein